jgi:murein tripeptide amidase MpaA
MKIKKGILACVVFSLSLGTSLFSQTGILQGGINGAYHSYLELEADLLALQQKYPNIVKVFDIGDSLEKRNIYALKISDNVGLEEDEAEVLFLGCHHAREWISVEVPYLLGKYLAENYASDPDVRRLVDQSEVWIVPLVNPDGLEYTIHVYRYWRKNRRDNGNGNWGVDLNRNYGYRWGADNIGSSSNAASAVYRGTAPFSEPETQAVRDLFLKKNFQAMISYHSFSQVILYPWGYTRLPTEKDAELEEIAAQMSARIEEVNGRIYPYGASGQSLYLTNGDTTDWTFGISGIPSFTIELPPIDELAGGFFNREEDIAPVFQENLPAMLFLIESTIRGYVPVQTNPFHLGTLLFKKD